MEILYLGSMCSEKLEKEIIKIAKTTGNVAQNNLERALIERLVLDRKNRITAFCMPCMPYEVLGNKRKLEPMVDKVFEKCVTKTYTVMKIPVIKYVSYFLETIRHIRKWIKINKDKKKLVYITVNFVPVSMAVWLCKRVYRYKTVAMVSDLAQDSFSDKRVEEFGYIKKSILPIYKRIAEKLEEIHDGYIFLSESMNCVNKKRKPYIVMEGIYNNNLFFKNIKQKKNIIMYAGALNEKYGIKKILDVFFELERRDIVLEIYGDGPCRNTVLNAEKEDERIVYKGFVERKELFERMQEARLLINLRDPQLAYTKYSFPSKMFEYMVSGTPVLTTELEGIPNEYYQYVYSIKSYATKEIAKKMDLILSSDLDELRVKGLNARRFILEEKTGEKQVERIAGLLEEIVNRD